MELKDEQIKITSRNNKWHSKMVWAWSFWTNIDDNISHKGSKGKWKIRKKKKRESVYLDIADGPTRKRPNEHEHLQRICGKIHLNREKLEESLNSWTCKIGKFERGKNKRQKFERYVFMISGHYYTRILFLNIQDTSIMNNKYLCF